MQLEDYDTMHIDDLAVCGDGMGSASCPPSHAKAAASGNQKVADLYKRIKRLQAQGLAQLMPEQKARQWANLYSQTDAACKGWLQHGCCLVQDCASMTWQPGQGKIVQGSEPAPLTKQMLRVHNVLVTNGQLVPSLAKVLLFRLHAAFSAEDVYSSRTDGKKACFDVIEARFGKHAAFCTVGESWKHDMSLI